MGSKLLSSMLAGVLVLAISLSVQAEEPRLVSVTGEAVVKVTPDRLVISFDLISTDSVLAVAKTENDRLVSGLQRIGRELDIKSKHIQTDRVRIRPRYFEHEMGRDFFCIPFRSVEAGADSRAAHVQRVKLFFSLTQGFDFALKGCRESMELLAKGHGDRVLHFGAPHLQDF